MNDRSSLIRVGLEVALLNCSIAHKPEEWCETSKGMSRMMTCPWCALKQSVENALDDLSRCEKAGEGPEVIVSRYGEELATFTVDIPLPDDSPLLNPCNPEETQ